MTTRAQFSRRLAVAIVCAGLAPEQPVLGQTGQDKFFESDGVPIRYQITGEGVPVILLHGLGGTLESWQRVGVTGMLARHFRVVAMDMRGHGQSGKPHDPKFYGPALAADIVRLLNHIGATKAHVVGYSLGGLIALDFAALQQKHAASVLIGGTGWPPPDALNNFRKTAEGFEQGKFRVREGNDAMAWAALSRGLRILSADKVHRIKIPMALVIGADDAFLPDAQRLARAVPTTKVVMIPGASHDTAISHPKFAEAVLAFLLEQRRTVR